MYRVFFLDVDGTLLNSVSTKNKVFVQSLAEQGIPRSFSNKIILETVSLTRAERFQKIWSDYHNKDITAQILKTLLLRSEELLSNIEFEQVTGSDLFLKTFANTFDFHVISAANNLEVMKTFTAFGWEGYFKTIHTGIKNKSDIYNKLMMENDYLPTMCLAVGDTEEDFNAAFHSRIDFWRIMISGSLEPSQSSKYVGSSSDFLNLVNYLDDNYKEL